MDLNGIDQDVAKRLSPHLLSLPFGKRKQAVEAGVEAFNLAVDSTGDRGEFARSQPQKALFNFIFQAINHLKRERGDGMGL